MYAYKSRIIAEHEVFRLVIREIEKWSNEGYFSCNFYQHMPENVSDCLKWLGYKVVVEGSNKYNTIKW